MQAVRAPRAMRPASPPLCLLRVAQQNWPGWSHERLEALALAAARASCFHAPSNLALALYGLMAIPPHGLACGRMWTRPESDQPTLLRRRWPKSTECGHGLACTGRTFGAVLACLAKLSSSSAKIGNYNFDQRWLGPEHSLGERARVATMLCLGAQRCLGIAGRWRVFARPACGIGSVPGLGSCDGVVCRCVVSRRSGAPCLDSLPTASPMVIGWTCGPPFGFSALGCRRRPPHGNGGPIGSRPVVRQ